MDRLALFVATAGYVGYAPIAPGTAGSIVGLVLFMVIRWIDSAVVEASVIGAALVLGLWAASNVERQLGKDPSVVVIDEVVGMLITLAFLDVGPVAMVIGFILFRVLDVIKPFPAGRLEDLHGGPGIMLDDVMAGLYGQLLMRLLIALSPGMLA
jgi:phosphatidylglycerophosphatase A